MKIFKNFFSYSVCLVIVISFIGLIFFGALLKHHYSGGKKFKKLQNIAVFFASIPTNARDMIKNKNINLDAPPKIKRHSKKKRFQKYLENSRDALLILPRYDHDKSRSIVEVVDLKNFEIIHTYINNIDEINAKVQNFKEFNRIDIDDSPVRFEFRHPLILKDGSLISDSDYSPEFKIDFCSNLIWVNDEESFHHSKMLDHEGNIWIPGVLNPYPEYMQKYFSLYDDSIVKINTDGKILFNKSVIEILITNEIFDSNFFTSEDPIHLNDIEPAFNDTNYWKKGDIFLSARHLSAIIHYRPSTNEVINFITGPFNQQHDVDIISDKEISIFNNNNFLINNEYSEVLIYNFETESFSKMFNKQLLIEEFKTKTQGLSHIFEDGSLLVEEQNFGRIILFNKDGQKEWEYVNIDKNGDIGFISWSRVVEDRMFIKKFKSLVKNVKCLD